MINNRFQRGSEHNSPLVFLDPTENEEHRHGGGENDEDVGQDVKNNRSHPPKLGIFGPLQEKFGSKSLSKY